ncbi:hypothetical protein P4T54_04325 [Bacillus mycoides]|uniref:hypothetical protein n=1 Tax=Bacillus TaxID=1386 RepID=UPI0011CB8F39|nr:MULTISPECIES: hypothetical protein [Bacillus]MBK5487002.1 hypothetical protein [Bacillus sp. TH17]MBK5504497.1 hypothetical protein [Bacillus sp. TH12]MCQ6532098.1 hypothetical protein [Bacillus mycoides]MDR4900928.1 hypothetical protein [Bacillus mycoides]MED1011738.1 hypothetical protein [Bacillus mycoides]
MKKLLSVLVTITVMAIASYSLMKVLLYYANKSAGVNTVAQIEEVQEKKKTLDFVRTTHESYNNFLNYGKAEKYTDGDWKHFKQWFQEQEASLKNIHKEIKNEKIKRDVNRSYEIVKKGVELQNIEYVIYAHRVYHDLDILVNKHKGETNIWGYTEFGDGQNIRVIEQAIQTK